MHKRTLILLFWIISLFSYARMHSALDSVYFNPVTFENRLDSLFLNQFRFALSGHDQENTQMISSAKSSIYPLNDSLIAKQIREMHAAVRISYQSKIREYLEVLLVKKTEAACLLLTLAGYYVPAFEDVFKKYNIPRELTYLPSVISMFNPGSISAHGSTGIWSIMYLYGKLYNLEINSMVDERKNVEKSTEAAALQLKDMYGIYKDWTLALAAYITDPAIVNKAIRRANGKKDFWSLYPFLPMETRDYIPAFIAMCYFVDHHDDYNLKPLAIDFGINNDTIHVCRELHMQQVSKVLNIPMTSLRELNPQFKRDILPAQSKVCILCLPPGYAEKYHLMKDSIFHYIDSVVLASRQSSYMPGTRSKSFPSNDASTNGKSSFFYTVKPGESLGSIAGKYHTTVQNLKSWNDLKSTIIKPGQKLLIYSAAAHRKADTTVSAKN